MKTTRAAQGLIAIVRTHSQLSRSTYAVVASALLLAVSLVEPTYAAADAAVANKVVSLQRTLAAQPDAQAGQAVTQLADGSWLLSGGSGYSSALSVIDAVSGRTRVLPYALSQSRVGHSATLLPDGTVFVYGGDDSTGGASNTAEVVDIAHGTTRPLGAVGLLARTGHTATLLADGTVLLLGGHDARGVGVAAAELFDPTTGSVSKIGTGLDPLRWNQVTALLPTSSVLMVGGKNATTPNIALTQALDPVAQTLTPVDDSGTSALITSIMGTTAPAVVATTPAASASDFPVNGRIVVKLSKRMNVATLNAQTATLVGPNGPVNASVVGAERGLLLFVTPTQDLLPATHYSLFVKGASDELGQVLPMVSVGFSTGSIAAANARNNVGTTGVSAPIMPDALVAPATPASPSLAASQPTPASEVSTSDADLGQEDWTPERRHQHGNWRTGRHRSRYQSLPPLQAGGGVTALAGQVLKLNGMPLANAELRSSGKSARTDATGRFLLKDLPAGAAVLEINGASADGQADYGYFSDRVVVKAGVTTPLAYTIWMTRLDTAHTANIASPTTQETVITNPLIPGLELHLPAGTVIKDRQGKIVTQISITAIPVDRPPFPLPVGVNVPTYFTVQPGGATIENLNSRTPVGARLIYPNFTRQPPGSTVLFWDYDPTGKGWYVYGKGKVSDDGTQSIPDPGVAIYQFTGAMVGSPNMAPPDGPPPNKCPVGDPVDCSTGIFIHQRSDIHIADVIPIDLQRTYVSRDSTQRAFGIGATHQYDMFLIGDTNPWTYQQLILPDGGRIQFSRTSAGTSYSDAVYLASNTPSGKFAGATLTWDNPNFDWDLRTKDGSVYQFPDAENNTVPSLSGMTSYTDPNGNKLTIERNADDNNVSRVVSPNGRYITFTYDNNDRVTQITDISGRSVSYQYDDNGRLSTVTNAMGGVETYTYDDNNNMLSVTDPRGNVMVTNTYEPIYQGIATQTMADGGVYQFSYGFSSAPSGNGSYPKHISTDVTNPAGVVSRRIFDTNSNATTSVAGLHADYALQFIDAVGTASQRTQTAVYDTSDRVTSFTDWLGRTSSFSYDSNGNLSSSTILSGTTQAATTTAVYDGYSRLTSVTNALGNTRSYTYDSRGNWLTVTDALGHIWTRTVDAQGSLTSETDPLGNVRTAAYSNGLISQSTDEDGSVTKFSYDALGRMSQITDPLHNTQLFTYDSLDRLTSYADALSHKTQFSYDANGNMVEAVTPTGLLYSYSYDSVNRPAAETNPMGKTMLRSYDKEGRLTQFVDRKGQTTAYSYNVLDQLQTKTYVDGVVDKLTFDLGNRLLAISRAGSGTYSYSYDGLDDIAREQTPTSSISYTFDQLGRRTSMLVDSEPSTVYQWDNADRLISISQTGGATNGNLAQSVSYSWDNANHLIGRGLPNGVSETRAFTPSGNLTQLSFSAGSPIGSVSYAYDAMHRRISQNSTLTSPSLPSSSSFQYDIGGRLSTFNANTMSYDDNGNLLSDGQYVYVWDGRDKLAQIQTSSGQSAATFSYDPLGRRSAIMLPTDSSPRSLVYDGKNLVEELASSQVGGGSSAVVASYLNGLSPDETITRFTPQTSETMLTDGLGSVVSLTNAIGAITTQYSYTPYGVTLSSGNASVNPKQFTGRENDGTGLYFYRARYYSPALGRFISPDPSGWAGGQVSLYSYANGNPLLFRDPNGLQSIIEGGIPSESPYAGLIRDGGDLHPNNPGNMNFGDPLPPNPNAPPMPGFCHDEPTPQQPPPILPPPPGNVCPVPPPQPPTPQGLPAGPGYTRVCTYGQSLVPSN